MKKLTDEEYYNAPEEIKLLYVKAKCGFPIRASIYDELREKYPEYFPKEN